MTFTIVFTTAHPRGGRSPGWTTIQDCASREDAVSFFLAHRGRDGIPSDTEIESVRRA